MNHLRIPGLELVEPLRANPITGGVIGALTGIGFGLLSGGKTFPVPWADHIWGFALGGLVGGVTIGALLPVFRRRWKAGIAVALATTLGLIVASRFWGEEWPIAVCFFVGGCCGLVYAVLMWDYRPAEHAVDGLMGKNDGPK